MADNATVGNATGQGQDITVATDDDGTAHHPYVKLEWGADNTQTKVAAGANALPIQDGGNSITVDGTVAVSGTVAVTQSGTWDEIGINDSGNSITVDDGGSSLTIDGTVTADTELPSAAALADNTANPTAPAVGAFGHVWDGATWDRTPGTAADGVLVNLGTNNDVTVTGSVTANAGTNLNTSTLALESGGNLAAVAASASVLDDWDESDRAKVNPIVGQAGVAAGAGAVGVTVQRVTLASDDPAVTALQILDNAISGSEMQVDVVAALPAGTNAIGKLAANSGVDIGDVDVTSVTPGTAASSLGKAEDAAHTTGDVGVMLLAVRRDAGTSLVDTDGDYAPLQVTSAGALSVAGATAGPVYGNTTTLESTGLNSLASSTTVGYATAEVDNTSTRALDVLVMVEAQMTTSGSPTGYVEVYALASLDGSEYSGDTSYSGTAGSYTLGAAGSANLTYLGGIKPHANTNTYRKQFSLAAAFGGYVPAFWAIVVVNNSGIALHTSGSTVTYRTVT